MAFTIRDKEIHSLDELRENFDLTEITAAFLDRRLERWLGGCYYDRQAEAVKELRSKLKEKSEAKENLNSFNEIFALFNRSDRTNEQEEAEQPGVLPPLYARRLCTALGVDYTAYMPDSERPDYERRLSALRQYTEAPELLALAFDTATNQAELAELLRDDVRKIVLCGGSFTVPIRVRGIHYIGVGNPTMEAPYTEEQYRRAGITFENVVLPEECGEADKDTARAAAAENGFDDFFETHTPFATLVHEKLKRSRLAHRYQLDDGDVSAEIYKHKSDAEKDIKLVVNAAYEKASAVFDREKPENIAEPAVKHYSTFLCERMTPILKLLPDCEETDKLQGLTDAAESSLRERFHDELGESYYRMYKRSYFLEKPEVENLSADAEYTDSVILNGIMELLELDTDYMITGLMETVDELEDDVNSRADTFFASAHRHYQSYCAKIEEVAEELGKKLSDDDLERLGLKMKPA